MADLATREKGAGAVAVGAALASRNPNLFAKQWDNTSIFFKPKVPALPKLSVAPIPKALPLASGPMLNLSGGPVPLAPGPAGGILPALPLLGFLAMLAKAVQKMLENLVPKKPALQPAH
jgi:hypothetical protein